MILCLGTTPAIARTMRFRQLTLDAVNRTADVVEYAAGKSVNAARAIKTVGGRPTCLGVLGGARGKQLRRLLDDAFVAHDFVEVTPQTRLCTTVIDDATRTATELVEESSELTAQDSMNVIESLRRQIAEGSAGGLVLSGSLAPGVPTDFCARCVDLAADAGLLTLIDASGPPLLAALEMQPSVVKVNATEFCQSFSIMPETEQDLIRRIREVAQTSGSWLVVTRGGAPTIASDGEHTFTLTPPTVDVVSPIGGGDVFAGVLTYALAEQRPIDDALRQAIASAAANAMTPHAAHFDAIAAMKLQSQVEIREC
jgi:tagatose 6-phosphate kinase